MSEKLRASDAAEGSGEAGRGSGPLPGGSTFSRTPTRITFQNQVTSAADGVAQCGAPAPHIETPNRVTSDERPRHLTQTTWFPIETAPKGARILLWWTPVDVNPFAECAIIGQVSAFEPGRYWDGQRGAYDDLERITHWMPLPMGPER